MLALLNWLKHLDRLLRGDITRPEELREGRINIDAAGIAWLILILGAIYGVCMGSYSLLKDVPPAIAQQDPYGRAMQVFASMIKVPALFYLTLLVTFPSLYVFNALVGSRLTFPSVLRLLLASLAINLAVLASLGPIVMFFSLSTQSYSFIQVLNVIIFTVAGVLGLTFLLQTLHRLTSKQKTDAIQLVEVKQMPPAIEGDLSLESERTARAYEDDRSALEMGEGETLAQHTRLVFGCWVVVFAVVGAQMGWVLRPFIGSPGQVFTWFRERDSNFFQAVFKALAEVISGGG